MQARPVGDRHGRDRRHRGERARSMRCSRSSGRSRSSTAPRPSSMPNSISTALMQAVTDAGVELTGAEFAALFSGKRTEDDHFELYALSGIDPDVLRRPSACRARKAWSGLFSRDEQIFRWDDVTQDPNYAEALAGRALERWHAVVRSYLAVPLVSRGRHSHRRPLPRPQPGRCFHRTRRTAHGRHRLARRHRHREGKSLPGRAAGNRDAQEGRGIAEQEQGALPRLRRGGLGPPVGDRRALPHHFDRRRFPLRLRPAGRGADRAHRLGVRQGRRDRAGVEAAYPRPRDAAAVPQLRVSDRRPQRRHALDLRPTAGPISTSTATSSASAAPRRTSRRASTPRRSSRRARASSSPRRC